VTDRRWLDLLTDPSRYVRELERLRVKVDGTRRSATLTEDGVAFGDLVLDLPRLGKLIAREIAGGTYAPRPGWMKRVLLDKPRDIFYCGAIDLVVHGVVGAIIAEAIEPTLSPRLYSYRHGISPARAVRDVAAFVRSHRRALDPPARGLHVFRGDVRAFSDSIPVGANAPLWFLLRGALGATGDEPLWRVVEGAVRPEIAGPDGSLYTPCVGLPQGSPVTIPLLNLYLRALDHELAEIDGGFYGRFGDDIFFAHPGPNVTKDAVAAIRHYLQQHGLELNTAKARTFYWNGAGRSSPAWSDARGTTKIVFLGSEIRFDGTIALPRLKTRVVLADLRQRLKDADRLLGPSPRSVREATLCRVVNDALDVRTTFCHPYAADLHALVTSRSRLAELDHLIALAIAEQVSGRRGPRAFRDVPWRRLRREHGLMSLVALRNARS
jgi:hypothetical protein